MQRRMKKNQRRIERYFGGEETLKCSVERVGKDKFEREHVTGRGDIGS